MAFHSGPQTPVCQRVLVLKQLTKRYLHQDSWFQKVTMAGDYTVQQNLAVKRWGPIVRFVHLYSGTLNKCPVFPHALSPPSMCVATGIFFRVLTSDLKVTTANSVFVGHSPFGLIANKIASQCKLQ